MSTAPPKASLLSAFTSWRLGAVTLLSLSSGLPLGLVITAVPAWLAMARVDIKTIGLITLVQLPYGFKFVWSPLMDRLRPPFMGSRRGWIFLCQLALGLVVAALGFLAASMPTCEPGSAACAALPPLDPVLVSAVAGLSFLIAFASASQDIVYDAYAVEVLEKHEHGAAVGARSALYRVGLWMSGNIAISLAPYWGWSWTLIAQAAIYLALLPVTVFAPEPKGTIARPQTLKEALWLPFVGFLGRPRALEITAFVLLYRLGDSIAGALVSPFLLKHGYSAFDVGVVRGGVGIAGTLLGTILGGMMAARWGLGRALWICGVLQIISNSGYAVVAVIAPTTGSIALPFVSASINVPLQTAIFIETMTGGMGWGAFGVLLLRLTDKRFSATQYAFFSSLVGLARTFVGPPAGVMADALGWRDFFLLTMAFGIPGMVMLRRFVPWGSEPKEVSGDEVEPLPPGPPWGARVLWAWGAVAAFAFAATSLLASGLMATIKAWRAAPVETRSFDFAAGLRSVAWPESWTGGVDLASAVIFGLMAGLAVAAGMAARGRPGKREEPGPAGG